MEINAMKIGIFAGKIQKYPKVSASNAILRTHS